MPHFYPALLLTIIFFSGCQGNGSAYRANKRDTGTAVTVKIPDSFMDSSLEQRRSWFCRALEIPLLDKAYNGLQLRITEDYLDGTGRLIFLKDSATYWSAGLFNYKTIRNESRQMKLLVYQRISLDRPKSDWNDFKKKLFALDLKVLQIQRPVIDQFDTESVVAEVEMVADHNYTRNNFGEPYKSQNQNIKRVVDIVNFLKEEFEIR